MDLPAPPFAEVESLAPQVFFLRYRGWDSHFTGDDVLAGMWANVNDALTSFAAEMKAKGQWGNVTVVIGSEFGRTVSTNGKGTDHGWGGNTFVMGGDVSPEGPEP